MLLLAGSSLWEIIRRAQTRVITNLLATYASRFRVHPVYNVSDLKKATALLYRQYRKKGYCPASPSRLHFSPHMFADKSLILALKNDFGICGTMSVFPDSAAGLPLEKLYPVEISEMRKNNRFLTEVGCLALELPTAGKYSLTSLAKMVPLFSLIKMAVNYTLYLGLTDALIVVHPCHEKLYRFMGFKPFGPIKSYEGACGNPALPMRLDLTTLRSVWPKTLQRYILDSPHSEEAFSSQLAQSPNAFGELFGDSFYEFEQKFVSLRKTS